MILVGNTEVVPVRLIDGLPYVCTAAAVPPQNISVWRMPLNSSYGRHEAQTIGTGSPFKYFPSIYGIGYRNNGTNQSEARIEALVSLHVSCDTASCPAFGYQGIGGQFVTRNCGYSNNKVTPYLSSSASVIHRTESHALGTSLTTGTTGYELTLDGNTLWYANHQVRYRGLAFYLVQAYCYGDAPQWAQDCLWWRINNYGYGEHEISQVAATSLINHTSEAGLNTYTYIVKSDSILVDPSMPSVYNTLLRLSRANMPKLEMLNDVPDGCYIQIRSFGYKLTPYDSPDYA